VVGSILCNFSESTIVKAALRYVSTIRRGKACAFKAAFVVNKLPKWHLQGLRGEEGDCFQASGQEMPDEYRLLL
jgi:hypothetical protein